ncbi:hypothetical protein [Methylobacterium radiodurans]|uniref:Uncharacterized protein n=1 Tax=Methylobacterium radiodurans TaxID=2202828 RepID=A0A2U8VQD5_9HYPH|nr:hypothetical protein [Methylobacterium radiodurans]AWN35678.1 hypothetical protein DK427_07925 [Methylobacterium radiodurans]
MTDAARFFDKQVAPEFRRFIAAEGALTQAALHGTPDELEAARDDVMQAAWNAATKAHQMGDYAWAEQPRPSWMPANLAGLDRLRDWLQANHCKMLRGIAQPDDVHLLGDVADAFKHAVLTQGRRVPRRITSAAATVTSSTGFGKMAWGEGKFGGVEQVIVTLNDGTERALSCILQNVVDAWRAAMGRPLPPMGE